MGWPHLTALALLSCVSSTLALGDQNVTRNVTADELLHYGVAVTSHTTHRSQPQPGTTDSTNPRPHAGTSGGTSTADPAPQSSSDSLHLSDSDFVFAAGACMKRIRLAQASRSWRGPAVRAFFLTDSQDALATLNDRGAQAGEAYGFFPSEGAPELGGVVRSLRAGDTRAALTPFAAHRHYGETYKWMLYGDDDTVFFLDAVKPLVASLDPEQPIALSDNLWYMDRHPNPNAPRCLPCHMANETLPSLRDLFTTPDGRVDIRASYQKRGVVRTFTEGEYLDWATNSSQVPGERYRPEAACPYCSREAACGPVARSGSTAPCKASVAHGGAGMIFSVGLMRSIRYRDALECVLAITNSTGSDHLVSECLWRAGFAFTDPGSLVRHMYSHQYVQFGGSAKLPNLLGLTSSATAAEALPPGTPCQQHCRWMLRNVVSVHMLARLKKNWKLLAKLQEELPRTRLAALAKLGMQLEAAGDDKGEPRQDREQGQGMSQGREQGQDQGQGRADVEGAPEVGSGGGPDSATSSW